jgi:hypothetical protein
LRQRKPPRRFLQKR